MKKEATLQLNLFDAPSAAKGELVCLPTARLSAQVQRVADELLSMSKSAGQRYWTKHAAEIRRNRKAQGFTSKQIDDELDAYARAISRQMDIAVYYRGAPDGAA